MPMSITRATEDIMVRQLIYVPKEDKVETVVCHLIEELNRLGSLGHYPL